MDRDNFIRFNAFLENYCGIHYDIDRAYLLKAGICERMRALAITDLGSYYNYLQNPSGGSVEIDLLTQLLTIGETCFFRDDNSFIAIANYIIPEIIKHKKSIRILSAAASTGEEPFSLRMLMNNHFPQIDCQIVAIDINSKSLALAKQGKFYRKAMTNVTQPYLGNYFTLKDNRYLLDPAIVTSVDFLVGNLNDMALYTQIGRFDFIVCRNVFIYFTPQTIKTIIAKFKGSLYSDGFLMLGHSESLRGVTDAFEVLEQHNTFFYRVAQPKPMMGHAAKIAPTQFSTPIHVIERSEPSRDQSPPVCQRPYPSTQPDATVIIDKNINNGNVLPLSQANDKRATEHTDQKVEAAFKEALQHYDNEQNRLAKHQFETVLNLSPQHLEAQLGIAALLAEDNKLEEAHLICQQALKQHDVSAEAHFVMGLINEHNGALDIAQKSYQAALFLNSRFALAHFKLGFLLQQQNRIKKADKSFDMALKYIDDTQPRLFQLYTGGFNTSTIRSMCKSTSN